MYSLESYRKAADCHKHVRDTIVPFIQPNIKYIELCNLVENTISTYMKDNYPNDTCGIAFPTCISENNIAAHDTAGVNDSRYLNKNSIYKIDFGTHFDGYIIDSAFSISFNPTFDPLLEVARESVDVGIKNSGVDAYIYDVSSSIQEVIESYDVDIFNKSYPLKSSRSLGGHNISRYTLHGDKLILGVPNQNYNDRMNLHECFAIETFPSTGTGDIKQTGTLNNYIINNSNAINVTNKKVYDFIKSFNGLPFCSRWIHDRFGSKYKKSLSELLSKNIITGYPPLSDVNNSYVAQFEHTIFIHEDHNEILSKHHDY